MWLTTVHKALQTIQRKFDIFQIWSSYWILKKNIFIKCLVLISKLQNCIPIHLKFCRHICLFCKYLLPKLFLSLFIFRIWCKLWTIKTCHHLFKMFQRSYWAAQCENDMQVLIPHRFNSTKHRKRLKQAETWGLVRRPSLGGVWGERSCKWSP